MIYRITGLLYQRLLSLLIRNHFSVSFWPLGLLTSCFITTFWYNNWGEIQLTGKVMFDLKENNEDILYSSNHSPDPVLPYNLCTYCPRVLSKWYLNYPAPALEFHM